MEARSAQSLRLEIAGGQELGVLAEGVLEKILLGAQLFDTAGQVGEGDFAGGGGPGIDAMMIEIVSDEIHGLPHVAIESPCCLQAKGGDHRRVGELVRADAGESAVAAGGAPADVTGLEQADLDALLRQFKSGGEAGEATADDGDLAGLVAGEGRRRGVQGIGGGFPIAVNGCGEMEGMRMCGGWHDATLLASDKTKSKRGQA